MQYCNPSLLDCKRCCSGTRGGVGLPRRTEAEARHGVEAEAEAEAETWA